MLAFRFVLETSVRNDVFTLFRLPCRGNDFIFLALPRAGGVMHRLSKLRKLARF